MSVGRATGPCCPAPVRSGSSGGTIRLLLNWGLGTLASSWLSSVYTNPYYVAPTVVSNTAQAIVADDYSRPIDTNAAPPEPSASETAMQVFQAARDAFKSGDVDRPLSLADQVLQQQPNDPAIHEFRALMLFALKRYDEAAGVAYAVLTDLPGMNWTTGSPRSSTCSLPTPSRRGSSRR